MSGADPGPDLEAELDALYGMAPGAFVAARDDLARRLRAAGRRDDAAAVKRLRRPTVAAWALNQLSRRRGDDLRRLVEHGEALRRAQEDVLAGAPRDRLTAAGRARRQTIDGLADAALELIAGDGAGNPASHRDDVLATLDAASLDADAATALLDGRLVTGMAPTSGFDLLATTTPDRPRPEPRPDVSPDDGGDAARAARMAEAREVAGDARDLASRRRSEAHAATAAADRARRAARAADEEVERLTGALERARRAAAEAADAVDAAVTRATDAERAAAAAEAQAQAAAAAVARLEGG